MLKSVGRIVYNPYRGGMKNRTNGWCIIDIDKELTRYYRHWLKFQYHINLQQPSWDAHISCIRGESLHPELRILWGKYMNTKVEFEYDHGNIHKCRSGRQNIEDGGEYYYMHVTCPTIDNIRHELGLSSGLKYHFTIGRTHEHRPGISKHN
jgi:hypothetical protein